MLLCAIYIMLLYNYVTKVCVVYKLYKFLWITSCGILACALLSNYCMLIVPKYVNGFVCMCLRDFTGVHRCTSSF